jgi:hypothetical protein
MTSVTVNGNTYSDDGTSAKDMLDGGFRANFIPLVSDTVVDTAAKVAATAAQVAAATTQAGNAATSAASALAAPGTNATSATSVAVGLGSKSLTIQTGKSYVAGMNVVIADSVTPTNSMFGNITSYNSGTGALIVNVAQIAGSGTVAAWTISLAGPLSTGVFNALKGADIASAATINLDTASGNFLHVTGVTTITAITLASGAERTVVFDGALTLTYNATTLILPGASNILTAAGDTMNVRGDGAGNVRVTAYNRKNGYDINGAGDHKVVVSTGNGLGSTNTTIRRFTTTVINTGTAITYADSATLGASFTINESGIYFIQYSDIGPSVSSVILSISKNSTSGAPVTSANANTLAHGFNPLTTGSSNAIAYCVERLVVGDVIYPKANTNTTDASSTVHFTIVKVAL